MKKIINTICDLKTVKREKKAEEVSVSYPHPKEVIEDVLGDMLENKRENLFFKNGEDLKDYLAYLFNLKHHEKNTEFETRNIRCNCGSIWKVYYEPHKTNLWDNIGSFEYEEYGINMLKDHVIGFRCSICNQEFMINNVLMLYKIESIKIPPKNNQKFY